MHLWTRNNYGSQTPNLSCIPYSPPTWKIPPLQLALSQSFVGNNLTDKFKYELCFGAVFLPLFLEHPIDSSQSQLTYLKMASCYFFIVVLSILVSSRDTSSYGTGTTLGFAGIFPGTLWCGDGNIADDKSSLGIFPGADR